jgi:hypothetical protein
MKNLLTIILWMTLVIPGMSQDYIQRPEHKKDYSVVFARVSISENKIMYVTKGLRLSPLISMPDGKDYLLYDNSLASNEKVELPTAGNILNYMAKFGWNLLSTDITNSTEVNPKEYNLFMYFERDHIEKK